MTVGRSAPYAAFVVRQQEPGAENDDGQQDVQPMVGMIDADEAEQHVAVREEAQDRHQGIDHAEDLAAGARLRSSL